MKFYDNFVALCEKIGKTPFKVTQELGLSNSIVSLWRNGKRNPNHETLQKIAEYFNTSIDELIGNQKTIYVIENYELTPEQAQEVRNYINYIKSKDKE